MIECERITIDSRFKSDPEILAHVKKYAEKLNEDLNVPCGYTDVDLDAMFSSVRYKETNLCNLIADVIRTEYDTDFSLFNTGTFRSNAIIHKGILR